MRITSHTRTMQITEHTDPFDKTKTFWVVNNIVEFHSNGGVYPALTLSQSSNTDHLTQSQRLAQLNLPAAIKSYYDIKHLFTAKELTILMLAFGPIDRTTNARVMNIATLTDVVYDTTNIDIDI
jgi:hypothetical protein